ncbi:sensor histidine kinase [Vibrio maerlii]|uniref:sensor histidine kinase n=1 Tax=Vibrio maerlii TaxID=2231648 RepID=UPI000E3BDF1A|nr:ATP-binding protein [Vibrio maerlii]
MVAYRQGKISLLILYLACLGIGSFWIWHHSKASLYQEHAEQLERFTLFISSKLDKYAHIPELIAKDDLLVGLLQSPSNSAQKDITNRYLESINNTIQSTDVYLLDTEGTTLAASNWNLSRSFVGKNYAWRPYFYHAVKGQAAQYFALGSSSKQRGYYFSYPVIYAADVIGIIVVKMDLSTIEANWKDSNSIFVATDDNQVIFMSNKEGWLFKSLIPLTSQTRQQILNSRQYLDQPVRSLNLYGDVTSKQTELVTPHTSRLASDYLMSSLAMENHPLTIRVLTSKLTLLWPALSYGLLLTLLFVIAYLSILLNYQRQLKKRQFEQLQYEAKQKAEFLVMERTAELHAEIGEKIKTETKLRETQDDLIQAAKLAVLGQMSASISHELNNPLAAIRSFADNGRRFLEKEKFERVDDNLSRISALTDRMAKISQQLRTFSRKSDRQDRAKQSLIPIIESAHELLIAQLKSYQINFQIDIPESLPQVDVNAIQLEQVVINLVTNAIQAFEVQQQRHVCLSVKVMNQSLIITIDDNGPGIELTQQRELFKPFVTTKKNGVGLGLSISQQLIEAMQGQLEVDSSPLGGARFIISLPSA